LHRWRGATRDPERNETTRVIPSVAQRSRGTVCGPARAERIVAAKLDVANFDEAPFAVYEMYDGMSNEALAALPHAPLLSWSRPLAAATLDRLRTYVASREHVRLRWHGEAATQAAAFAETPVRELTIAGPCDLGAHWQNVRELTIDAAVDVSRISEAFPNLRALRIGVGARRVDFAALARVQALEYLDCSHVRLVDGRTLDALAPLGELRALRVARVDGLRSLSGLERLPALQTLAIEQQHLESLVPLPACASIEQLELIGMWQYSIDDLAWVHELPRLLRVEIDIGGRRKNLELYRRARWAYPWPVFSGVRATLIERPG